MVASCLLNHYRGLLEEGQEMGILTEKCVGLYEYMGERMVGSAPDMTHIRSFP